MSYFQLEIQDIRNGTKIKFFLEKLKKAIWIFKLALFTSFILKRGEISILYKMFKLIFKSIWQKNHYMDSCSWNSCLVNSNWSTSRVKSRPDHEQIKILTVKSKLTNLSRILQIYNWILISFKPWTFKEYLGHFWDLY